MKRRYPLLLSFIALLLSGAMLAQPAAAAGAKAASGTKLSMRQKKAIRAHLMHLFKTNPQRALAPSTLREAALVNFDLPVTIRFNPALDATPTFAVSDDVIGFDLGTSAFAGPPAGVFAGPVQSTVDGGVRAILRFGVDTSGYGEPGMVELAFTSFTLRASQFPLVDASPPCGDAQPLLRTDPSVAVLSASGSFGRVSLFRGSFAFDLHTRFQFTSQVRQDCSSSTFAETNLMSGTSNPPIPLNIEGDFRISPAMTADGYLRLGKLTLTGAQQDAFGYLHTCTASQTAPGATCDGNADDLAISSRLSAVALTAEMIIGNAPVLGS